MGAHHDRASGLPAPAAEPAVALTAADTLSDVLETVRLTGALFFLVDASTPWVAEAPASPVLGPVLLPRVQHVVSYHVIRAGACWCESPGEPPMRLEAGDVLVVPHRQQYALRQRTRSAQRSQRCRHAGVVPRHVVGAPAAHRRGGRRRPRAHRDGVRLPGLRRAAVQSGTRHPAATGAGAAADRRCVQRSSRQARRFRPGRIARSSSGQPVGAAADCRAGVRGSVARPLDRIAGSRQRLARRVAGPGRRPRAGATARAAGGTLDARAAGARRRRLAVGARRALRATSRACRRCTTWRAGACSWQRRGCRTPPAPWRPSRRRWATTRKPPSAGRSSATAAFPRVVAAHGAGRAAGAAAARSPLGGVRFHG